MDLGVEPSHTAKIYEFANKIEEDRRNRLQEIDRVQSSIDTLAAQRQEIRRKARLDTPSELDDEATHEALQHIRCKNNEIGLWGL